MLNGPHLELEDAGPATDHLLDERAGLPETEVSHGPIEAHPPRNSPLDEGDSRMTTFWMDGQLVDANDATVSPLSHALHYGTGVFEGIRSYETPSGPRIFRLEEHMARLTRGAEHLGLECDLRAMTDACASVLRANELGDAYVRPLAWFDVGGLGLDLRALSVRTLVAAMPWSTHLGEDTKARGVTLRTSSWRRTPATSVPALKLCGNYVNSVLANREALLAGYDEALFVDDHGFVVEGSAENVFMVRNGSVVAVQHRDALPGITRDTVCELTGATSRPVTATELADADEVFLVGTSVEVTGVSRLDQRDLGVGPVTSEVAALYQAVVRGQHHPGHDWLAAA